MAGVEYERQSPDAGLSTSSVMPGCSPRGEGHTGWPTSIYIIEGGATNDPRAIDLDSMSLKVTIDRWWRLTYRQAEWEGRG